MRTIISSQNQQFLEQMYVEGMKSKGNIDAAKHALAASMTGLDLQVVKDWVGNYHKTVNGRTYTYPKVNYTRGWTAYNCFVHDNKDKLTDIKDWSDSWSQLSDESKASYKVKAENVKGYGSTSGQTVDPKRRKRKLIKQLFQIIEDLRLLGVDAVCIGLDSEDNKKLVVGTGPMASYVRCNQDIWNDMFCRVLNDTRNADKEVIIDLTHLRKKAQVHMNKLYASATGIQVPFPYKKVREGALIVKGFHESLMPLVNVSNYGERKLRMILDIGQIEVLEATHTQHILPTATHTQHTLPTATHTQYTLSTATHTQHTLPTAENTLPTATDIQHTLPTATHTHHTLPTATHTQHTLSTATHTQHTLPTATLTQHTLPTATLTQHTLPTSTHTQHTLPTATHTQHTLPTAENTENTLPTATHTQHTLPTATHTQHTLPTATHTQHTLPTATLTPHTLPTATHTQHTLPTATHTQHTLPTATLTQHTLPTATHTQHTLPTATLTPHTLPTATHTQHTLPTATYTQHTLPTATHTQHTLPKAENTENTLPTATHSQHTSEKMIRKLDENEIYAVDRIIGKRRKGKRVQYHVLWKNYTSEDSSWEDSTNILDINLIKKYNTK